MDTQDSHTELVHKFSTARWLSDWEEMSPRRWKLIEKFCFPKTSQCSQFDNSVSLTEIADFFYFNWSLPITFAVIYLAVVFGLQEFMKERKPTNLKWSLFVWNSAIGVFSIFGFIRTFPELWKFVGREYGFYESICIPNYTYTFGTTGALFAISKIPELVDTVFVVLKKKPVEAVQWFHHVATMTFSWVCLPYFEPLGRYVVIINFGVHSLMYPYFALKSIGVNIPRGIAKFITTCQFAQMVTFLVANSVSTFYYLSGSRYCYRHPVSLALSTFVIVVFVAMFGNLFKKLVLRKSRTKNLPTKKE